MESPERPARPSSWIFRSAGILILACLLLVLALMWWWDTEPDYFDPVKATQARATGKQQPVVIGSATTSAVIESARVMLEKRGGYLSNDKLPPGVFMDNMPNWEFGVVTALRDMTRALRNEFSRSQTQSVEDKDCRKPNHCSARPTTAGCCPVRKASIARRSSASTAMRGDWPITTRTMPSSMRARTISPSFSGRLDTAGLAVAALVSQCRPDAHRYRPGQRFQCPAIETAASSRIVKTPWTLIDDNFYEARGYTWALREQLEAIRVDFGPVLRDKNAMISLEQVIREIEEAQKPLGSPMVLNGSPFGFFGNHSLVLANYISRANAALIELRDLLRRG